MGVFTGWPARRWSSTAGSRPTTRRRTGPSHRDEYDAFVLEPMQALLEDLGDEFGEGRIFRPYRDIRFSADKSPYKTAIGATLGGSGYVQFSAAGLGVGAGCHVMAPDQLARFRAAVDEDAAARRWSPPSPPWRPAACR